MGVATADGSLQWLNEKVRGITVGETGYGISISKEAKSSPFRTSLTAPVAWTTFWLEKTWRRWLQGTAPDSREAITAPFGPSSGVEVVRPILGLVPRAISCPPLALSKPGRAYSPEAAAPGIPREPRELIECLLAQKEQTSQGANE